MSATASASVPFAANPMSVRATLVTAVNRLFELEDLDWSKISVHTSETPTDGPEPHRVLTLSVPYFQENQ